MRRQRQQKAAGLTALTMALTLWVSTLWAADISIRFPVEYNLDIAPGVANQEFAQQIEERSGGRIEVKMFPSGNLYRGLELVQAILRGDAEMSTLISAYWTAVAPELAALELPYAFPTQEAFYRAVDDPDFFSDAYAQVEAKGGKVIAVLPYDYLVPGTLETPLRQPNDMKSLKMRGLGKVNLEMLQQFGAQPVSINFVELSAALQQGVIDGLNVPIDAFISYKWYESVSQVNYAPYYVAYYPWVVNLKWWESLSSQDQKIIEDTAKEVALGHRERAREVREQAIDDLRTKGVEVHLQTDDEIAAWREAAQPVWDSLAKTVDPALIARMESFAKP